jgi:hypothetical protein
MLVILMRIPCLVIDIGVHAYNRGVKNVSSLNELEKGKKR